MASLSYSAWSATCDTLHAHTQVLGKIAVDAGAAGAAAPARRAAADRARVGERAAAGARRLGALVVGLDLHAHEAFAEHSDGRSARVPLTPDRAVAEVTRELLGAVRGLGGADRDRPEAAGGAWTVPLDEDDEHATYDPAQVADVLRRRHAGRARARRVPRALPRPLHPGQRLVGLVRPRGQPLLRAARPSRPRTTSSCATRWTPRRSPSAGGPATRADGAAFYAYAHPAPEGFAGARPRPAAAHWDDGLGLYMLEWDDVVARRRPARHRARVRPLRLPARLRRLRLGPGPPRLRRGRPASRLRAYGNVMNWPRNDAGRRGVHAVVRVVELHWPLPPLVTDSSRSVPRSSCGEPESPKHSPEPVPTPLWFWLNRRLVLGEADHRRGAGAADAVELEGRRTRAVPDGDRPVADEIGGEELQRARGLEPVEFQPVRGSSDDGRDRLAARRRARPGRARPLLGRRAGPGGAGRHAPTTSPCRLATRPAS